jgi:hypothetical protein
VTRRSLYQIGLALGVSLGLGCATPAPPPAETGQLFLWEVARPDGSGGVAHLLGSVHMADAALELDPAVDRALADADALVLEIDPHELDPQHLQRLALEKGSLPSGQSLEGLLSPEAWSALSARLAAANLPVEMVRGMKPWYALLTLQMLALQRQGYDVEQGVETALANDAVASQKPTQGLETVEEQLDMLSGLPLELQVRQLEEFVTGDGSESGDLSTLIEAWERGDAEQLEHEVFGELERDPSLLPYYERFYFERNDRMADEIAERVDRGGRWFVAVGAAHVVGARGIPSLLEREGYRVRRVPRTVH